jgi:hypothetical protein
MNNEEVIDIEDETLTDAIVKILEDLGGVRQRRIIWEVQNYLGING